MIATSEQPMSWPAAVVLVTFLICFFGVPAYFDYLAARDRRRGEADDPQDGD